MESVTEEAEFVPECPGTREEDERPAPLTTSPSLPPSVVAEGSEEYSQGSVDGWSVRSKTVAPRRGPLGTGGWPASVRPLSPDEKSALQEQVAHCLECHGTGTMSPGHGACTSCRGGSSLENLAARFGGALKMSLGETDPRKDNLVNLSLPETFRKEDASASRQALLASAAACVLRSDAQLGIELRKEAFYSSLSCSSLGCRDRIRVAETSE